MADREDQQPEPRRTIKPVHYNAETQAKMCAQYKELCASLNREHGKRLQKKQAEQAAAEQAEQAKQAAAKEAEQAAAKEAEQAAAEQAEQAAAEQAKQAEQAEQAEQAATKEAEQAEQAAVMQAEQASPFVMSEDMAIMLMGFVTLFKSFENEYPRDDEIQKTVSAFCEIVEVLTAFMGAFNLSSFATEVGAIKEMGGVVAQLFDFLNGVGTVNGAALIESLSTSNVTNLRAAAQLHSIMLMRFKFLKPVEPFTSNLLTNPLLRPKLGDACFTSLGRTYKVVTSGDTQKRQELSKCTVKVLADLVAKRAAARLAASDVAASDVSHC